MTYDNIKRRLPSLSFNGHLRVPFTEVTESAILIRMSSFKGWWIRLHHTIFHHTTYLPKLNFCDHFKFCFYICILPILSGAVFEVYYGSNVIIMEPWWPQKDLNNEPWICQTMLLYDFVSQGSRLNVRCSQFKPSCGQQSVIYSISRAFHHWNLTWSWRISVVDI